MDILAKKLRERAQQLGISNAEAARQCGLEERRYAHYASGRREPDLATLKKIAQTLGTTPNWLLGAEELSKKRPKMAALVMRFTNAASGMSQSELEICIIQAEAIVASKKQGAK